MRKLKRFKQLAAGERRVLLHVFVMVSAVRVALWILPVQAARRIVARASACRDGGSVRQLVWAVRAASRYVPGASCLTQAIAAQALLGRYGVPSQIEIGVSKNHSRFHAHAWLVCQGQVVLGGPELEQYNSLIVWES
jgi:Transglutaminase-like superfamily